LKVRIMNEEMTGATAMPYGAVTGGRHACMLCNALNCVVPPVTGAVLRAPLSGMNGADREQECGPTAGPVEQAVKASVEVSFARQTLLTIDQTEALECLANLKHGLNGLVILNTLDVTER
jgi:hypothetical protein